MSHRHSNGLTALRAHQSFQVAWFPEQLIVLELSETGGTKNAVEVTTVQAAIPIFLIDENWIMTSAAAKSQEFGLASARLPILIVLELGMSERSYPVLLSYSSRAS